MDEEIQIINENTRYEKVKNFFINNKKKIVALFATIILLLFTYFIYKDFEKKRRVKISNQYNIAITSFNSGDKKNVENELVDIINKKDIAYSPLALYFLIDNKIITKPNKINDLFDVLINDTNLEKEIKNLIIYKKALFNSDFESEKNLMDIIKPLINSNSIWKSHGLYLMGEYFYFKNEKQKAKDFFSQILNLENSNEKIKIEAQKRLNRDLSE
tara:strand:- start:59 stop:703 length:645 start_codon:yes stop_codon:yes gene_type:complete